MGNTTSQQSSRKSLDHVINYIAARYIRSQNFQDMKNLSNLEYCDKLVILTSKIISKYLDETSIKYLSQKKGIDGEKMVRDNVLAIDKDNLDNLDEKNTTKKRRLCIGLAKHYVQVANLFAAIASTINPTYMVTDETGETKTVTLEERDDLPQHSRPKISKENLCSNRVAALLNHQDIKSLEQQINEGKITLNPDFCSFNCSTCPSSKDLGQEPGIPELEALYFDKYDYDTGKYDYDTSKFNYDTGKFDGMSKNMAKLYKADVDELYKIFTGNDSVPETVKKFSDIKLKNYFTTSGCENSEYTNPVVGSPSNYLFYSYVDNVKKMLASTKKYHDELLDILDQLFVFGINPETKYKTVLINPNLNDRTLKMLTQKTIVIIANLYASCERGFAKGVEIYTNIANKQLLKTSESQIATLSKIKDGLYETDTTYESPEQTAPSEEQTAPSKEQTAPSEEQTAPTEEQTAPSEEQTAPTEEVKELKSQEDIIDDVIKTLETSKKQYSKAVKEMEELKEVDGTKTASPSPEVSVNIENRIVNQTPEDIKQEVSNETAYPKML